MIRSQNGNPIYWEQGEYPDWSRVSGYRHFPNGLPGTGVEPHYHDNDEMWLFTAGHGEVWLDDVQYAITPGTMVYTPMGCPSPRTTTASSTLADVGNRRIQKFAP
jgi:mannose-6-phosphate isomerase-like protein (cupin superfamily)